MEGEILRCRWDDFPSMIQRTASGLFNSLEMSDMSLVAGERVIPCHKIILSAASEWFRNLFGHLGGQERLVIVLKDVDPHHLEFLLQFIYRGEVCVPQSELKAVLEAAQVLGVTGLHQQMQPANPGHNPRHKKIRLETQSHQQPSSLCYYSAKAEPEQTCGPNEEDLSHIKTEITEEDCPPQPLLHSAQIYPNPTDPGPLLFPDPYSFCSRCKDVFDKRANPIPCIKCNLWFHLKCRGGHSC